MKKDGLALVFITILLCAAAAAAATGALTDPSKSGGTGQALFATIEEGTVESCFVDETKYAEYVSERNRVTLILNRCFLKELRLPMTAKAIRSLFRRTALRETGPERSLSKNLISGFAL